MASSYVGGLSGAFIPVSERDAGMIAAVDGSLTLEKLEAMTCVCSVGLDMIAIPGDTSAQTISAIIADEAAIGMINNKTTAVRLIPVPGKGVGDVVEVWRPAWILPYYAGEYIQTGCIYCKRRTDSSTYTEFNKLMTKKKTALILACLEETYAGTATALKYNTPFELLVAVILSAQCT